MAAAPVVLSRNANGVLPVPIVASEASTGAKPAKAKAIEGDKVVIRRLPPGLTEDEFVSILGDEWKQGRGRVGWLSFHPGKVSKDPSKPSRPAFAALHVLHRQDLGALSETVRTAAWADAKDTWTSPVLVGPPAAEFSLYKKVPSGKRRTDSRQGTIDQDAEFMAFLEALANPTSAKDAAAAAASGGSGGDGDAAAGAAGDDDAARAKAKATSTPLIDFLREKKASKSREAANAKASKQGRDKGGRGGGAALDDAAGKKRAKGDKSDRAERGDRADRERGGRGDKERSSGGGRSKGSVKILTKKAIADAAGAANSPATTAATAGGGGDAGAKEEMPKSRRAGILAAARILQRDLGLSPGLAHRKARAAAQAAQTTPSQADSEPSKPNGRAKDKETSSVASETPETSTPTAASPTTKSGARGPNESTPSSRGSRGKKNQGDTGRGKAADRADKTDKADKADKANKADKAENAAAAPAKILLRKETSTGGSPTVAKGERADKPSRADRPEKEKPEKTSGDRPKTGGERKKGGGSNSNSTAAAPASAAASVSASSGATRAFVKHANPSQGVTEALLHEAMQAFGAVTLAEIDRRKGFAFVDFADHEGLVRAMAASPITVAQAAVQVLERKDRKAQAASTATPKILTTANGMAKAGSVTSDKTALSTAAADGKRPARRRGGRRRGGGGSGGGGGEGESERGGATSAPAAAVKTTG